MLISIPRHIFHTEHEECRRISLPAPLARCVASADTVVVLCGHLAFVWTWERGLEELPIDPEANSPQTCAREYLCDRPAEVLLSALRPNWVFLFRAYWYREPGEWTDETDRGGQCNLKDCAAFRNANKYTSASIPWFPYKILVAKYERSESGSWALPQRFEHNMPISEIFGDRSYDHEDLGTFWHPPFEQDCRKVNNRGTYQLGAYWVDLHYVHDKSLPAENEFWHTLDFYIQCFDIFSGEFFLAKYDQDVAIRAEEDSVPELRQPGRLWNNRLFSLESFCIRMKSPSDRTQLHQAPTAHSFLREHLDWCQGQQWPLVYSQPRQACFPPRPTKHEEFFIDDDFIVIIMNDGYFKFSVPYEMPTWSVDSLPRFERI